MNRLLFYLITIRNRMIPFAVMVTLFASACVDTKNKMAVKGTPLNDTPYGPTVVPTPISSFYDLLVRTFGVNGIVAGSTADSISGGLYSISGSLFQDAYEDVSNHRIYLAGKVGIYPTRSALAVWPLAADTGLSDPSALGPSAALPLDTSKCKILENADTVTTDPLKQVSSAHLPASSVVTFGLPSESPSPLFVRMISKYLVVSTVGTYDVGKDGVFVFRVDLSASSHEQSCIVIPQDLWEGAESSLKVVDAVSVNVLGYTRLVLGVNAKRAGDIKIPYLATVDVASAQMKVIGGRLVNGTNRILGLKAPNLLGNDSSKIRLLGLVPQSQSGSPVNIQWVGNVENGGFTKVIVGQTRLYSDGFQSDANWGGGQDFVAEIASDMGTVAIGVGNASDNTFYVAGSHTVVAIRLGSTVGIYSSFGLGGSWTWGPNAATITMIPVRIAYQVNSGLIIAMNEKNSGPPAMLPAIRLVHVSGQSARSTLFNGSDSFVMNGDYEGLSATGVVWTDGGRKPFVFGGIYGGGGISKSRYWGALGLGAL